MFEFRKGGARRRLRCALTAEAEITARQSYEAAGTPVNSEKGGYAVSRSTYLQLTDLTCACDGLELQDYAS